MKSIKIISLFLWLSSQLYAQTYTLSGYVREASSQESLAGVSVWIEGIAAGTISNTYGFFALQVPDNQSVSVAFSLLGYEKTTKKLTLSAHTTLNVFLKPQPQQLQELEVLAKANPNQAAQMSVVRLSVAQIKQIPSLLGEKDVIKALQFLPGVQKGTEGSTALYVRGGGPDQNLILLDEAQVYNANHLFGFFSIFNGDAIKNVEFWKGGFPARYGGRLSSVIDLQMKDGNKEKLHGEGGIGLLSSRLTLEGPLAKGKSSFLISSRRTYIDLLLLPLMPKEDRQGYRFYDFNAKLNFDIGKNDKLYVSGYFGNDALTIKQNSVRTSGTIAENGLLGWGNATGTLRWNHLFSQKLFLNTTLSVTDFKFLLSDDFERTRSDGSKTSTYTEFSSGIRDYSLKADFDYFPNNLHQVKFGGLLTNHRFSPRGYVKENRVQNIQESDSQVFQNVEFAGYVEDTYQNNNWAINTGIRLNGMAANNKTYFFVEPRLSASYSLPSRWTLKASYARNNQFVHLLTNTGTGLSTDLWVPANDKIPPQQADQIAVGLSKSFQKLGLNLTIESYRKWLRNIVSYKEGASFLIFADGAKPLKWEDNITTGSGWAYGTEVLLQKNKGRLTGWLGYTLSWTVHQFDALNGGKRFYPRYDRRHDLSLVASYKLSPKIILSANWVYATGNSLTVPNGFYFTQASITDNPFAERIDYLGSRNSFRAEPYHRLDIGIQFHKKKRWGERTWEIGFYNAYSRKNPMYYYLKTANSAEGQVTVLGKKSLFPIVPSVTYSFKF